jgi:hypothetical protein
LVIIFIFPSDADSVPEMKLLAMPSTVICVCGWW